MRDELHGIEMHLSISIDRKETIMQVIRKESGEQLAIQKEKGMVYLTFPMLTNTGVADHLFSTRLGGVSRGYLGTMNLSYTRGDEKACVDENFSRIGQILGIGVESFVFTDQTHTANVRRVGRADCGKGIVRERDYTDIDGLVTNEPGVVLSAFFADCVPLYFIDPVKKAIGLSHSGWKGTVQKIGEVTVKKMQAEYGSNPVDIVAAIGPSICGDCYEVSEDVAEAFREAFVEFSDDGKTLPFLRGKGNGKYQLDLWEANRYILLESGLLPQHISMTDICTCCNPDFLFSHRASSGKRGNLGAFLVLK